MPAIGHVGQVDEEISRQRAHIVRKHAVGVSVVVGTQYAHAANQNGHFCGRKPEKLSPIEHHFLGRNRIGFFLPAAEPVCDRLQHAEAVGIRLRIGCIAATRRKGHINRVTARSNRLLQPDIATEHDDICHGGASLCRDRLEDAQHLGQTVRLIASPVFLGCQADTGAIGSAALVRATECPGAVPGRCDQFSCAEAAIGNLRLHGRHIIAGGACGHGVLPDQVFGRDVGAVVIGLGAHVAVGQFEPSAGEGVSEVGGIGPEFLADLVVDRVNLHGHVCVCHQRHGPAGRIAGIERLFVFRHVDRGPLVGACGGFCKLPIIAEEVVEIAHVPLGGFLGPSTFDTGGEGIRGLALMARVVPAEALHVDRAALGLGADMVMVAAAVGFANRVATTGQGGGFLVVHSHAGKGFPDVLRRARRIRIAVHALRVHVDQAHMDRRERVLEGRGVSKIPIAVFRWCEPFVLRAPVNVCFRPPDIFAAKTEAKGFQAHGLIGHIACQNDQVRPRQRIAVLLLYGPEQAARFIEAGIVRPRVQRRKADIACTGAAAAVLHPVRARRMPCQTDHEAPIVAPVCRPPILAFGHQGLDVGLYGVEIQRFDSIPMVVVGIHRIGARTLLVQDVEVEPLRPPLGDGFVGGGVAAVIYGAAAEAWHGVSIHGLGLPLFIVILIYHDVPLCYRSRSINSN